MIGELTAAEIDEILRRQRIGRIGSESVGHVQIIPIVYGYDGSAIYGHSHFGRKIQYMRGNPEVCFEVEEVADPSEWRVIVLTGEYEELHHAAERDHALGLIRTQAGGGPFSEATYAEDPSDLVIYRIRITDRFGRFESPSVVTREGAAL